MELKRFIKQEVISRFTYNPNDPDSVKRTFEWLDDYQRKNPDHEILIVGRGGEVAVEIRYPKFATRPDYPQDFF